jgi:outer membrane protein
VNIPFTFFRIMNIVAHKKQQVWRLLMEKRILPIFIGGLLSMLLFSSICLPVFADQSEDLTETTAAPSISDQSLASTKGFHGMLGAGLALGETVVGHRQLYVFPVPFVSVRYSDWAYWNLARGGVWLLQSPDRSLKLGIGLGMRFERRSDDDDSLLRGMADRHMSLDGSVNAEWRNRIANIRVRYFHDLLGVSDGDGADIDISHMFTINQKFSLTPFVGMEWLGNRLVNYYYGVRPEEATSNRPEYRGRDTVNLRTGLWATYRLSPSWSLISGIHVRRAGDGIYDSPIVLDRYRFFTFFGAGWRF